MEAGVRECHDRSERSGFEWNHYAGPGNRARVQHDCIRLNQCGGSFGVLQPVEKTFSITGTGETILAAKLELGTHQTLAHQDAAGNWVLNDIPNKVEETRKCQRYQKVFNWGTRNFTAFYGFTTSATTANLFLPVGVPLRITPTILDTRGENWAITLNGNTIIPEAIQTWFVSDTMIGIRVKAEYPTGAHHFVTLNSNSANNVIFDANL